ncbi:hypothetical protein O181_085809 [Austropuccinia psidii MF-1]|uniref:Uncharacterized protein n=1 Tax=Austropuccinia psidii MF-1 TaxID=1389203 RepID=A0A9Q3FW11_9BASI|nr:hypothetical protein [Austropuccinia psidii MF-1]
MDQTYLKSWATLEGILNLPLAKEQQNAPTAQRFSLKHAHIKDTCRSISPIEKSKYLQAILYAPIPTNSENDLNNDGKSCALSNESRKPSIKLSIPSKRPCPETPTLLYFWPISKEKTQNLHELLYKALITSKLQFRFIKNPFFQQYQE